MIFLVCERRDRESVDMSLYFGEKNTFFHGMLLLLLLIIIRKLLEPNEKLKNIWCHNNLQIIITYSSPRTFLNILEHF